MFFWFVCSFYFFSGGWGRTESQVLDIRLDTWVWVLERQM